MDREAWPSRSWIVRRSPPRAEDRGEEVARIAYSVALWQAQRATISSIASCTMRGDKGPPFAPTKRGPSDFGVFRAKGEIVSDHLAPGAMTGAERVLFPCRRRSMASRPTGASARRIDSASEMRRPAHNRARARRRRQEPTARAPRPRAARSSRRLSRRSFEVAASAEQPLELGWRQERTPGIATIARAIADEADDSARWSERA